MKSIDFRGINQRNTAETQRTHFTVGTQSIVMLTQCSAEFLREIFIRNPVISGVKISETLPKHSATQRTHFKVGTQSILKLTQCSAEFLRITFIWNPANPRGNNPRNTAETQRNTAYPFYGWNAEYSEVNAMSRRVFTGSIYKKSNDFRDKKQRNTAETQRNTAYPF